jgi:hypothetical protein
MPPGHGRSSGRLSISAATVATIDRRPRQSQDSSREDIAVTTSASLRVLIDPEPVGAILRCHDLPHTAPRLSPAHAPPQAALELDTDLVAPVDPLFADDFDQTPGVSNPAIV